MRFIECIIPFVLCAIIIFCAYIGELSCVAVLTSSLALYAAKGWMRGADMRGEQE